MHLGSIKFSFTLSIAYGKKNSIQSFVLGREVQIIQ